MSLRVSGTVAYRWNNLQCLQRLPGRGLAAKTFFSTVAGFETGDTDQYHNIFSKMEGLETGDTDQYPYRLLGVTLRSNVSRSLPFLLFVGREDIRQCQRYIIQRRRLTGRLGYKPIRVWPEIVYGICFGFSGVIASVCDFVAGTFQCIFQVRALDTSVDGQVVEVPCSCTKAAEAKVRTAEKITKS